MGGLAAAPSSPPLYRAPRCTATSVPSLFRSQRLTAGVGSSWARHATGIGLSWVRWSAARLPTASLTSNRVPGSPRSVVVARRTRGPPSGRRPACWPLRPATSTSPSSHCSIALVSSAPWTSSPLALKHGTRCGRPAAAADAHALGAPCEHGRRHRLSPLPHPALCRHRCACRMESCASGRDAPAQFRRGGPTRPGSQTSSGSGSSRVCPTLCAGSCGRRWPPRDPRRDSASRGGTSGCSSRSTPGRMRPGPASPPPLSRWTRTCLGP